MTYERYKIADITTEIPVITTSSFLENTSVLKLNNHIKRIQKISVLNQCEGDEPITPKHANCSIS